MLKEAQELRWFWMLEDGEENDLRKQLGITV